MPILGIYGNLGFLLFFLFFFKIEIVVVVVIYTLPICWGSQAPWIVVMDLSEINASV